MYTVEFGLSSSSFDGNRDDDDDDDNVTFQFFCLVIPTLRGDHSDRGAA